MIFCLNFAPLYKNTQTTNKQTPKTKYDFETTATESYTFYVYLHEAWKQANHSGNVKMRNSIWKLKQFGHCKFKQITSVYIFTSEYT